jgi:hypothetical protein
MEPGKERTLTRDLGILREFDENPSADTLVLYHHYRDKAFDCFNAGEFNTQMLRYYDNDYTVRLVVPRKIGDNAYFLVCLQNKQPEKDTLCEVAFTCMRQFVGTSMLVKKRCFVCNKQDAKLCTGCRCACFCSRECQTSGWSSHSKLCKLVKATPDVTVESECVQMKPP